MKELILKYKTVIKFILTFLLVYAVLTFSYKLYLQYGSSETYYPDYMTNLVARQSKELLETLGYDAQVIPHPKEASMKLIINNKFVARVIEGCNSVSVIILFASFIVAFAGKFKTTFFYLLAGSVLIYIANLVRVVILSVGLYHYPWRKDILHPVIFPAIIYGMVCLLWLFWVNRFSNPTKSHE
ncbi:exosortase family protein XrtF [Xanthomarina sp.]|uniref:exosortase family protein XrtF n=1 Tax=Xanthomarina sp. TaxID=1931211 RepID=UPI002B53C19F|nr:exosortase family protein XrtF [Xanthomarina sp.]HLV38299.1 exosortase family protein XrtF [Xanthomarina sp.]